MTERTVFWCPHCSGGRETPDRCGHAGAQNLVLPEPGEIFARDYEFISTLGSGGMGVVYKSRHRKLDRIVALKTLVSRTFRQDDLIRFQQEAKAAGKFKHRNLVSVLDFGITDDGIPFMSMEYLEGETLEQALASKKLSKLELLRIFEQCCDGLSYAHRHNVLHRDIKPANIMLVEGSDGLVAKILDFGIAKIADAGQSVQALTKVGAIFGTPPYMSPEQCAAEAATTHSDVYALGCVMYEAFAGRRPLVGQTAIETFELHRFAVPKPISDVVGASFPSSLDRLILRMLSKDPSERPSMDSLRWEIEQIANQLLNELERSEAASREAESTKDSSTSAKSNRLVGILFVVLSIGMTIAAGVWYRSMSDQPKHPAKALNRDLEFLDGSDKALPESHEEVFRTIAFKRTRETINEKVIAFRQCTFTKQQTKLLGAGAKNCSALHLFRTQGLSKENLHELKNLDLKEIHLVHSDIDDAALKEVVDLFGDKLENVMLIANENVTDKGLRELLRCKKLSTLRLQDQTQLTGATAKKALLGLPKLRVVAFSSAKTVTDDDLEPISRMHLTELGLSRTGITDASLNYVRSNVGLKMLSLDETDISEAKLAETIKHLPALHTLSICKTKVSEEIVKTLAARESDSKGIRLYVLMLDYLDISTKSFPYFPKFKHLYKLSLVGCPRLTQSDINSLQKVMPPNCKVTPGEVADIDLFPATRSF